MTWTDPVDATANVTAVTAAREKTNVLDNLRAVANWTSYTPVISQPGALTKTVTYAKYKSYGKTVEVQVFLTITGAGTSANTITVSLPVTAATSTALIIGAAEVNDSGVARYPCHTVINSTTTVKFIRVDISSPSGWAGVDPAFALGNTDTVAFTAIYEAA